MTTRLGTLGLAASLLLPLAAQAKIQAVIVQWGELEAEDGGPLGPEYEQHGLGPGRQVDDARYINHDTTIKAQLCRRFGIDAWLAKGPGDEWPDRVMVRVRHPTLTRPDGVSGAEDTLLLPTRNGRLGDIFTFDEPWERVPGSWTFEVVVAGEVLASKEFTVTPPASGEPLTICRNRATSDAATGSMEGAKT